MNAPQISDRSAVTQPPCAAGANLSAVDLNLLVALEALLEHCNVTRAADVVGLSQPAMSRALSRLRGMFDDDLLVRTSGGYVRTIRGEQLYGRLPVTLDAIRELVSRRAVGAEEWRSTIRLAIADHQAIVLLTPLLERLTDGPMNTWVETESLSPNLLRRLENGELGMAVTQMRNTVAGFYQRKLYADSFTCLLREGHSALSNVWSPDDFYRLRHAIAAPGHDGDGGHVIDVLANILAQDRYVVFPNAMAAALAVAEGDMVLTVPKRVAAKMAALLPLQMVDPPIDIMPYEVILLWHERSHRNLEHKWVRSEIAKLAISNATWTPQVHDA